MQYIENIFGEDFLKKQKRIESYNFIENFISEQHLDWNTPPATLDIVDSFLKSLGEMSDQEFAFLLTHSGYIPEIYKADSSQETLYSKLIETLILEWAKRIGFDNSTLPRQKSSMEDISIIDDEYVIVCDSKSFRLGRSQAAPNVKDVLKHADIAKWLSAHHDHIRLGGLIIFPSQHDWKRGSDYYQYLTDANSPTLSLYYEHLAYILLFKIDKSALINVYKNHAKIFPKKISNKTENRRLYYEGLIENLFSCGSDKWHIFDISAQKIVSEMVYHTIYSLNKHIVHTKDLISEKYKHETDIELLRKYVIEAESRIAIDQLSQQIDRINRFRTIAQDYHEE